MAIQGLKRYAAAFAIAVACIPGTVAASVTYHFADNNPGGNFYTYGAFRGFTPPFTFDFTVDNALAPNRSYGLGVAGWEPGYDGNVTDFLVSGGTALSTFRMADYFKVPNGRFAGYINSNPLSRIAVTTDASGAISSITASILARSTTNTMLIFQANVTTTAIGEGLYYDPALGYATSVYATSGCYDSCKKLLTSSHAGGIDGNGGGGNGGAGPGGVGGVGAVPEPATWALMIVGFGLVGSVRRRQRRQEIAAA